MALKELFFGKYFIDRKETVQLPGTDSGN